MKLSRSETIFRIYVVVFIFKFQPRSFKNCSKFASIDVADVSFLLTLSQRKLSSVKSRIGGGNGWGGSYTNIIHNIILQISIIL